jgi:hypothetical protein
MSMFKPILVVALLSPLALPLVGCQKGDALTALKVPAAPPKINMVGNADAEGVKRITLKEVESKRLGVEFAIVKKSGDHLTMPYNALLYDPSGGEWAFASTEANVYARTRLKVQAIEGDVVHLAAGPAEGTRVVTNGAAELYGIEFGVGK